jgi:pyrroloquinoline quinone biosynthesis protein B
MQLRILGSAAGGGFPQWNCACPNCDGVRRGKLQAKPRLQTQVAVSGNGLSWFLLGASPDLHRQIESSTQLQPRSGTRTSPVAGVVLASADLDHVLGLLLLRELHQFQVWATDAVIQVVRDENSMSGMLNRVEHQVRWNSIRSGEEFQLHSVEGEDSGISCRVVALSSRCPPYAPKRPAQSAEVVVGLVLTTARGKRLGFFPQLPTLTIELTGLFASLDLLLLDGTFWSEDELIRLQGSGQSAREMGHIPVGGEEGTLQQLSRLTRPHRMYIHINNTNPMLNEAGEEYRSVRQMGWELAEDGWRMNL